MALTGVHSGVRAPCITPWSGAGEYAVRMIARCREQFQRLRVGWRPAVAADVWMEGPILQIGGLHDACQTPGVAGRVREQLQMREVAVVRVRVGRPVEKPEGAQLIAREARDQQFLLGYGGPFKNLVQPRHSTSLLGHRGRDTSHVPDDRRSVLLAVAPVQPFGDRPCIPYLHRRAIVPQRDRSGQGGVHHDLAGAHTTAGYPTRGPSALAILGRAALACMTVATV